MSTTIAEKTKTKKRKNLHDKRFPSQVPTHAELFISNALQVYLQN